MLNEGQLCIETKGNKKAQEILIVEAAVDITWGSCPSQSSVFRQLLP